MTFQQLLDGAEVLSLSGNPSVTGIAYDSRRVTKGTVFVAMRGEANDGNRFIDAAIRAGAVAIVTDSGSESPRDDVAWAQVPHGRRALARLAANFYKHPAEKIPHVAGKVLPAPHTTPESLELNQMFAEALANGATEGVMEVSSHALDQQRIFGIPFDTAIFTNLTRDHLDYHKSMDEYFASKRILFEGCGTEPPRVAILNTDDEYGRTLTKLSKSKGSKVMTYGVSKGDFHAEKIQITGRGTRFDLIIPDGTIPIWSPLIGRVNVYNIVSAAAAAYARNCSEQAVVDGVANLARVPGRFERVDCGQPFTVAVD